MTSTTQEVTAEQIALALGISCAKCEPLIHSQCPECNTPWHEMTRGCALWFTHHPSPVHPYLEDSPEGYALLREFRADCLQRGWKYNVETRVEDDDIRCTFWSPLRAVQSWEAVAHGDSEPEACWTAWYRAVQAQEQA